VLLIPLKSFLGLEDTSHRGCAAFLKLVNMKFIVDVVDESEDFVPAALNCDYVIVTNI
jgi:hypothetical protein